MQLIRSVALLPALVLFVTCGNGDSGDDIADPGDLADGRFTATVTGAVNQSFAGDAIFGAAVNGAVSLNLSDGTFQNAISLIRTSGRPQNGNYTVGVWGLVQPAQFGGLGTAAGRQFYTTSGTLRITSSSSQRLEGTLQFHAADDSLGTPVITFNASFRALCTVGPSACN